MIARQDGLYAGRRCHGTTIKVRPVSERQFIAEVSADGRFGASAITHPGSRPYNEDSYLSCPDLGVWAVADGVGGHEAGEVASRAVTDALRTLPAGLSVAELIPETRLRLRDAHLGLQAEAARRGRDVVMATTVVVLLARGNHFACLWAGDSRAYLLRGGLIRQVTQDHSLVQEMLNARAISEDEAVTHPRANVITRAVGAGDPELQLDEVGDRLNTGDRFILCSDGLWKMFGPAELATILAAGGEAPAERLLATALDRQADDNVTVVTVQVGPG
jgi:serine/threonine-protein phosphatase Stp1